MEVTNPNTTSPKSSPMSNRSALVPDSTRWSMVEYAVLRSLEMKGLILILAPLRQDKDDE
jgi:hypothetical protein